MQVGSSQINRFPSPSYSLTAPQTSSGEKTIDRPNAPVGDLKKKRIISVIAKVILVSACVGAAALCIGAGTLFIRKKIVEESTREEHVKQIRIITRKLKNRFNSPNFRKEYLSSRELTTHLDGVKRSLEFFLKSSFLNSRVKPTVNAGFNENMDSLAKVVENVDYDYRCEILGTLEDIGNSLQLSPVGLRYPNSYELATDCTGSEGHFTPEYLAKLDPTGLNCGDFKRLYNITCLQKVGNKEFEKEIEDEMRNKQRIYAEE